MGGCQQNISHKNLTVFSNIIAYATIIHPSLAKYVERRDVFGVFAIALRSTVAVAVAKIYNNSIVDSSIVAKANY